MTAPYSSWSPPVAWLYASVATDVPGNRLVQLGGSLVTVASGYGPFPDAFALVDQALQANGHYLTIDTSGLLTIHPDAPATETAVLEAPDRLLALLGFDCPVGEELAPAATVSGVMPSPAAIPLAHCVWEVVDRERERAFVFDRFLRGHGDPYGGADVWRLTLRLEEPAHRALMVGWALSGRVMVSPYSVADHLDAVAVPWSPATPLGYFFGRVLGLEPGRWLDGTGPRRLWEGTLLLAREDAP